MRTHSLSVTAHYLLNCEGQGPFCSQLHTPVYSCASTSYTRPDAVLYSVSIGMSVGSLLSANVKTINYLLHYIISPVSTILPH